MTLTNHVRHCDVDMNLATVSGGPFKRDTTAIITSLYGYRGRICKTCGYSELVDWSGHGASPHTHDFIDLGVGDTHNGLDITVPPVQSGVYPLLAIASGTVITSDKIDDANGYMLGIISEDGEYYYEYYHLANAPYVNVGDHVDAGQYLAFEGTTGYSTGPHLHLGVMYQWAYIDPLPFLISLPNRDQYVLGSNFFGQDGQYRDEYGNGPNDP